MTPHVAFRKVRTLVTMIVRCANWPELAAARLGFVDRPQRVELRDGLRLDSLHSLRRTFGEIFEPAIADVYGIGRERADLVIDVGANIGAFSCLAARTLPDATIHAFEPSRPHADQLVHNVDLNKLPNVILHRFAVTCDGREIRFQVGRDGGSSGIFLPGDSEIVLMSTTLDTIDFSGARRAFIKLDCEGAEGEIIPWICEHRTRLPKGLRIACEYHHWSPVPLAVLIDRLSSAGFSVDSRLEFDEQYIFASSQW